VDDWLTIVLAAGLTARLTRLITLDTITQPIRNRLSGLIAALVECPWCTGVWAAAAVGLSWHWWSDQTWWQVGALIATLAWVAGAVSGAAMPRQHEVATVAPVALINADAPAPDTTDPVAAPSAAIDPEVIEDSVRRALRSVLGAPESADGTE